MMRHFLSPLVVLLFMLPHVCAQSESQRALGIEFNNPDLDTTAIGNLPVLEGQRFKPFDSLARERVRNITLDVKFLKCDPVLLYLHIMFEPEKVRKARIIHRPAVRIAEELLGYTFLSKEDNWTSYDELSSNARFAAAFDEARGKEANKRNNKDKEILSFWDRWFNVGMISGLDSRASHGGSKPFPAFPPRGGMVSGRDYAWYGPRELATQPRAAALLGWPAETTSALMAGFEGLRSAYLSGSQDAFDTAAGALKQAIAQLGAPEYPAEPLMDREVAFNQANYFSHARWLYVGATLLSILFLLLAAFFPTPFMNQVKVWLPMAVVVYGLYYHTSGLWIRTALSQRAMIGNFFDSMVFVAGACALLGVVFDLVFRKGWLLLVGSLIAWGTLAFAISSPGTLDPSIKPLMPVLINNYWIHIHVPTMMCSYAALGMTAVLGHCYLFKFMVRDSNLPDMKDMTRFMGLTMPVGVVLLFVGMVLGGIWADDSWGRFWGFDPKETWSLITWLVFMVLVHGYWAGWLRQFGTAMGVLVGGWSLVWTYWGANFFQSGLHSYAGASAEKAIPAWLWGFAIFEVALMGAATAVWMARRGKPTEEARDAVSEEEPAEALVG